MGGSQSHDIELSQGIPIQYVEPDGRIVSARDFDFSKVEFDVLPFSCGNFREAYEGKIFLAGSFENQAAVFRNTRVAASRLSCWPQPRQRGSSDAPFYRCVVKAFRGVHATRAAEWSYDLIVLQKANQLACKYNRERGSTSGGIEIKFASAFLYQVTGSGVRSAWVPSGLVRCPKRLQADVCKGDKVCVEPLLEGKFWKANCNNGYVRTGRANDGVDIFSKAAQAFSHWTWAATDGELLVCDLQGVSSENPGGWCWEFTDPAIHCAAGTHRFGVTDLGPRGINAFFFTHKCSELCQDLRRPEVVIDVGMHISSHTTFAFEVQVSLTVHDQQDFADMNDHTHRGTCYAHAIATAVRAAESRIKGRKIEAHHKMVMRLVRKHGTKGVTVPTALTILKDECGPRRLQHEVVAPDMASSVLKLGHAVLLQLFLSDEQWEQLSGHFRSSPNSVLRSINPAEHASSDGGHMAVIVGQDTTAWNVKNSWGDDFADKGFFKIGKDVLPNATFIHVYFLSEDLGEEDHAAYQKYCSDQAVHTAED